MCTPKTSGRRITSGCSGSVSCIPRLLRGRTRTPNATIALPPPWMHGGSTCGVLPRHCPKECRTERTPAGLPWRVGELTRVLQVGQPAAAPKESVEGAVGLGRAKQSRVRRRRMPPVRRVCTWLCSSSSSNTSYNSNSGTSKQHCFRRPINRLPPLLLQRMLVNLLTPRSVIRRG